MNVQEGRWKWRTWNELLRSQRKIKRSLLAAVLLSLLVCVCPRWVRNWRIRYTYIRLCHDVIRRHDALTVGSIQSRIVPELRHFHWLLKIKNQLNWRNLKTILRGTDPTVGATAPLFPNLFIIKLRSRTQDVIALGFFNNC